MTFDVRLGAVVFSTDTKQVGKVDGLVVDADKMNLVEIIVHQGSLFPTDRIVGMRHVDRVNAEGTVYLNIDAAEVEKMPPLVTHDYVVADTTNYRSARFAVGGGPTMSQPVMWGAGSVGRGMHVSDPAGYLAAVIEAAPVQVRSDLPDTSILIDTGTDVIASDGQKIGTVEHVVYKDDGDLIEIVARTGLIHHLDFKIPTSCVAAITHKHVRLNVSAEIIRGW